MSLIAAGATNREIAAERGYSLGRIKKILESIYRKLNTTNRITAINSAVLVGEIPCPHCNRQRTFSRRERPHLARRHRAELIERRDQVPDGS